MKIYLVRRLLQSLLVLFGVSFVVFFILYPDRRSRARAAAARRLGGGRPAVPGGDGLQRSVHRAVRALPRGRPARRLRAVDPPRRARLRPGDRAHARDLRAGRRRAALALCLAIPAGIVSAVRRNTLLDYVSTVVALLGQSMPTFWLGIMLILVFSVQFNLLPSSGRGTLEHLILPAVTLGLFTTARITRLTRSGHAGGAQPGLHPHGARQGRERSAGRLEARAQERRDPDRDHRRHRARARCWAARSSRRRSSRGRAWAGCRVQAIYNRDYPVVQAAVFLLATTFVARQSAGRRRLHLPRSADPPAMTAPSIAPGRPGASPREHPGDRDHAGRGRTPGAARVAGVPAPPRRAGARRCSAWSVVLVVVLTALARAAGLARSIPIEQDIGDRA